MSKQVDERVVSMQFDNKNFEKNVSHTMSTLDKFKQKLNLSGASKGLENVNTAAKKVDMSGLANGVETVRTKFSAMEVMGVTALANITNSAVNAGKRIASALTIDPIKTGFQEYETQINAVQTILANTESKGSTIDDVNKSLEELNKYADQTIYNFTEMTRNIGTFTAAGVDLETSTNAIKGIANLAAVSGSTSQQASTAMYQLSQALASGTVKLMDWNSVTNAGMGGQVFQDALKDTARTHGIAIDDMIKSEGSFRETLKNGWLTSEILTDTLQKFTMTTEGLTEAQIESNREMLRAKGYTEDQIEEIFKLGNTATAAATKVKTFTQLWDVLKEAAQSGWAQTWKIIVGDFEEAKAIFSPLADFLTGFINKMSDARNNFIKAVLYPWEQIKKKLDTSAFGKITKTIEGASKALEYYQKMMHSIWMGKYKNKDTGRYELLDAAGHDHRVLQDLVNLSDTHFEDQGWKYKLTIDDVNETLKRYGYETLTVTENVNDMAVVISELTDEQLKNLGLTDEEITLFRMLAAEAKRTGKPMMELIDYMSEIDGKTLLLNSIKNIGDMLVGTFKAVGEAWGEIFDPPSIVRTYSVLRAIHDFTKSLRLTDAETGELNETGQKLMRTLKGVFSILHIAYMLIGGPLRLAFNILVKVLEVFNFDILSVTASVGDAIYAFDRWLFENNIIIKAVTKCAEVIKNWAQQFLAIPQVQQAIEKVKQKFVELWTYIKNAFSGGKDFLGGLVKQVQNGEIRIGEAIHIILQKIGSIGKSFFTKAAEIGKNIIEGLKNGLSDGAKSVGDKVRNIAQNIITFVKDVLGIHSPSTEFIEIGKNIIAGLMVGLGSIKILSIVKNITDVLGGLGSTLDGVGDVLSGTGRVLHKSATGIGRILKSTAKVIKNFGKILGSIGNLINAKALQTLAISIAILAGSIVVLSLLDPGRMWSAVGVIVVLAGVLGGLMAAINKFGARGPKGIKEAITGVKEFGKLASSLLMISGSLLLLAVSLRIIGGMEWSEFGVAATGVGLFVVFLAGMVAAIILIKKFGGKKAIDDLGKTALSIGGTMILFAIALKIMGGMEWSEFGVAAAGMGLFTVFLAAMAGVTIAMSKWGGKKVINDFKSTISAISGAMLIFAISLKIMGSMEWSEFGVAAAGMGIFLVLITALAGVIIAVKKFGGKKTIDELGKTILSIAGAMLILTITAKIIAGMEWGDIIKAGVGLAGLVVIIRMMIQAVKLAGPNIAAVGKTLLAVSGAMLILTIVAKIIAGMEWGGIAKAAIGLAGLVLIVRMMIQAVKLAGNDAPKIALTLLALAAAVGILAGVAVLLSLVEIGALAKGIIAVGLLSAFMVALIKSTKGATDCMKNLIVITAAIAVMAAAVIALSFIDPTKLAGATIAIGLLMGMFAVMSLAAKNATGSMGTLIVMVVALGVIAGALYLLGQLPVEASISAAVALSTLMLSLSACLIILSAVGKFAADALLGVLALTAMAIPLLAFVGVLALMQNIQNVIPSVMALVALTTAMTLLLIPLTIVGAFGMAGLPYLGVLALLTMAVPLLAFVGILALMQNIQNAEQNAMILVKLMTTMTACLVAVSLVAPLALLASKAILALVGTITIIGVLITAIGALVTKFPQLEQFLDTGLPILEKIAYGIGSIFGNMISGFAVSAMSGLPAIGLLLSQFMVNATPFIVGAKMIDAAAMDGVKSLAEVILILTAADIIQGLTSWLTGGSSIAKFGAEIAMLGPYLKLFADSVAGIDATSVQAAATAAKALAEMTATIPNEGGVASWFAGENSIAKFSESLPGLGVNLKAFADNVNGINTESVTAAVDSAKLLADMTNTIPNEGGVASWFAGENSIATFAAQLPGLGMGLKGFSDNVNGINTESVTAAVDAAKAIVDMSNNIPNQGGVASWFAGDNSIAAFSSQLGTLGTAINTFATNVGEANVDNINRAVKATKSLSDLLSTDISGKTSIMAEFGDKLVEFGKKVSEFSKKMSGIKDAAISSAVDKFNQLVNMGATLTTASITSLTKFSDTLVEVANNGIKEFISALNNRASKADAAAELSDFVYDVSESIQTKSNKNNFKDAGKYLIEGLAEGIRANKSAATKAAQEVADAVEAIIRAAWQVNSPSKLFYKIALGIGEGIEYALGDSTSSVTSSARDLADTTSRGFGDAISIINDMFNGTFDAQPTIRPVLDLSDVQAGVNSIAGMFSGNRTLAISAPGIGAISASMANRQNGNNSLASAINKLAKSNTKSGDTYQINGISYREGSDVADAIQTLVRAAKMEGRT